MSFTVNVIDRNLSTQLDLYSTSELSDVTITCNGREFRAHSFVLAKGSPFFRAMLSSNFKEGQAGHKLALDTIPSVVMEKILPYFYGAEVELSHDDLLDVLRVADMWMLDDLKKICQEEFPNIVTQENALQMREIALVYSCPEEVVRDCEKKFFARLDECLHTDAEFLKVPHEFVHKIFR